MERIINIAGGGLVVIVGAAIVLNLFHDPMAERRQGLKQALSGVQGDNDSVAGEASNIEKWNHEIAAKPDVWKGLVPPPPPPAPVAPPAPEEPDLAKMLNGVKPTRQQVGKVKIKLITPADPKGTFYSVGDEFDGIKLKSFDKESVTFSYAWKEGNKEIELTLPRD